MIKNKFNYRDGNDSENDRKRRWRDLKDRAGIGLVYAGLLGVPASGVFVLSSVVSAEKVPSAHDISVECGNGLGMRALGGQTFVDLNVHNGKTISVEGKGETAGVAWDDTVDVTVSRDGLTIDGTTYDSEALRQRVVVQPDGFMGSLALIKDGDHGAGIAYSCEKPGE